MNAHSLLTQALVYLAGGVVSVPIAKRLGLGSVLGYLIAGVLIGPFLLNLVGRPAEVQKFAEFGVVILLFLIGLEVRPALLWKMRTTIFGLGLTQLVGTAALLGAASLAFGLDWRVGAAVGLILAMSSTAIVLQSLEEKGLRQGPVGQASFGVLLFQDLAVIPLFALLPLLTPAGIAAPAASHATSLLAPLPAWAQPLAQMAAVAVIAVGGRYLTQPLFRFIASARLREIFTASALLLVIAVAALMELVGLSPALGAFLAGVVLADSEFRRELETDIEPFRGLLLGLFFITVGAGLDLGLVAAHPFIVLGLVVGLMVLKTAAMYAAGRLFRHSHGTALSTAVALAQGGEFAFVLLGFVLGAQVMSAELAHLLTAVVAVSMAATPLVTAGYDRLVLSRPDTRAEPERLPFDEGDPDVIVAGFGRFGQIAARLLIANKFKVVLLDSSIEAIDAIRRFGWRVHYGDASRLDLLRTAGAEKAKVLLIAIDDRDKALEIAEAAKATFPQLFIVARAFDRPHAFELLARGVDWAERETYESALNFGRHTLEGLGFTDRRALKAAVVFREHDNRLFRQQQASYGQGEEQYVSAVRASRETFERLIQAEMARVAEEEERDENEPPHEDRKRLEADKERV
ncbi:monovalent cation:proton antiporter-2 (CPA2) family protein [Phenylobacterium sp.]|jgi:glutathione-regulated potassium-efflux system ancillary protein KefC/glutathione-regulated potassium-efflux system protein KefB|uniref:monovalent cation:proton antiporter-2 (CPA2) family protein n=1 Tax=Phenylobacterium sp. TaxID=1871053 RepID=UPI002E379CAB|nr:monovalent cation:proton antiporter-2 (CPA2) family protein [Phenylobacterium sp.]HEX3364120.1 monovalent cation:proton antiporter-2 (CPA2) family protein [Phenylobacterium sp.]